MLLSGRTLVLSIPFGASSFHSSLVLSSTGQKKRKAKKLAVSPHLQAQVKERIGKDKKKTACDHCLDHFDQFYGKTYGKEWPSLRLALLSRPKFAALVNKYASPHTEQTKTRLIKMGCYSVKEQYQKNLEDFLIDYKPPEPITLQFTTASAVRAKQSSTDEEEEIMIESMSPEQASNRLICPDEQVLAGGGSGPELSAASAAMFDHVPSSQLIGMEEFVEESQYYDKYQKIVPQDDAGGDVVAVRIQKVPPLDSLPFEVWTYPSGFTEDRLEAPNRYKDVGCYDYYCMDLASLIPVMMLDVKPGHTVLDTCAAPGGKSLAILQSCRPKKLVCNDHSNSRLLRVRHVMHAYLRTDTGGGTDYAEGVVDYSSLDAAGVHRQKGMAESFDRVLCDVECTTDRHSLQQPDGNWFKPQFKKQRLQLPDSQSEVLQSALQCLKVGGSLVYSTCSLSPVQNDGVVYDALKKVWSDTDMDFVVNDLSDAIEPFTDILKMTSSVHKMRYGQMVLPHIVNNFGPMYFSKITRTG